jgi:hypothetical protein
LALRHALLFPITEDSFITKLILSPAKNAAGFFFFIPCDQLLEKLLDAYQEGLLELDELRSRLPNLRKRSESLQSELRSLEATTGDRQTLLRLADNIGNFLERLRTMPLT